MTRCSHGHNLERCAKCVYVPSKAAKEYIKSSKVHIELSKDGLKKVLKERKKLVKEIKELEAHRIKAGLNPRMFSVNKARLAGIDFVLKEL